MLDYLLEEVLQQQPESIQTFLLRTSILGRMCGPLCSAVLLAPLCCRARYPGISRTRQPVHHPPETTSGVGIAITIFLPNCCDKRLQQSDNVAEYHIRASQWYEDNGQEIEAFQHAVAANDVGRAERLMESKGMPLHFPGAVNAILAWLASLPESVLNARPLLRVRPATMALTAGQTTGVEEKLQAAERALGNAELDPKTRDLIGQIACGQGHPGGYPLPGGRDDRPSMPRPGVSASRESAFPLYGELGAVGCLSFSG